jgi:hypothetical protein
VLTLALGRHARASAERSVIWELLRGDANLTQKEFTVRDFCELHAKELKRSIGQISPGASLEKTVTGALQGLVKKGLLRTARASGQTSYLASVYIPQREVLRYHYGRALLEAQRLHLL